MDYNAMELMICLASRILEDGSTVVVGTGAPCAAAMLAQKTHAPNLMILFEAGAVSYTHLDVYKRQGKCLKDQISHGTLQFIGRAQVSV